MYDQNTLSMLVAAHGHYQRTRASDAQADAIRLALVSALKEALPQFAGLHLHEALVCIIKQLESNCGWHHISASWALAAWLDYARDWLVDGQFFDYALPGK